VVVLLPPLLPFLYLLPLQVSPLELMQLRRMLIMLADQLYLLKLIKTFLLIFLQN
jgi:hypothetical protein